ncbi:hypothetical protein ET33_11200 [Paenibacillus tyrfis]|uniref:Transposase DDE domain-containing protein n=1 Tax=Paenibacillus tyrfis TaxID=1501230 RepID=A0A081P0M5_9BACL|nr:hypothetical protein ET33_11200 [Paenibacillus tyrfis]
MSWNNFKESTTLIEVKGRPPKDGPTSEQRNLDKQDAGERNAIDGKFGEGKRKYGFDRIRARLAQTSESAITLQLLAMNLERRLRVLFCFIFAYCSAVERS